MDPLDAEFEIVGPWPQVDAGFWEGRTVLVTGASGFKGSWLCEALLRAGAAVVGTVRSRSTPWSFFHRADLARRITTASIDVSRLREVIELVNATKPEIVFHLAAVATVPACHRDPARAFEVNTLGAINVLEACRQLRIVDRVLICSTDHVFGASAGDPQARRRARPGDGTRARFENPYDSSKAAMELAVRGLVATFRDELPAVVITRSANVFGPGDANQRRIVPEFISSSLRYGRIAPRYPKNRRQYICVLDVVEGYMRAVEGATRAPAPGTHHFALDRYELDGTSSNTLSAMELARAIAAAAATVGRRVEVVDAGRLADFAPNEIRSLALDCDETWRVLRWQPRCELTASLRATLKWYERLQAEQR